MDSKTTITFYGGVHEIGGNKFLIEDKGTKVFLDFGMQMGKVNQYFAEFTKPRLCNGMGDLFEFGFLPKLKGLYRKDYAKHMGFDGNEDTEIHGVLLTHAHVDHAAYIHYLRPDIPIYCSEATKLLMQAMQETGGDEDYITFGENFQIKRNEDGIISKNRSKELKYPRNIVKIEDSKKFKIDSIEVEPIYIDHSIPGVCGFILHSSNGSVGYTADIRYHGRRQMDTEKFVERCKNSGLGLLLCEGTRVTEEFSKSEVDVETDAGRTTNDTPNLVVCTFPRRDLDRLLSFYNVAKHTNRDLVIDIKQAYILKLFQTSESWKSIYPSHTDVRIKIYLPRRGWGLIDKDLNIWSKKLLCDDYPGWAEDFVELKNSVDYRYVSSRQNEVIFCCNDFQLQELLDIRPRPNSSYIRSSTEPFDDEMRLDEVRVKNWLIHFGLIQKETQWNRAHVSGHGSGDQIRKIIETTESKELIPIHTEHEEYHKKWHKRVKEVTQNESVLIH